MTERGRITHAVVEFITSVQWHNFPAEAVDLAKRCLIDGLAVMLAGTTTRGSAMLREYIRASGGAPEATVFASDCFQTCAASAALANASSGHAMDWDDTQLSSTPDRIFTLLTHPTMPPLAAALALGEPHHVSGASFFRLS
jgi:2-methylcitrate dehydratase PrpD